MESLLNRLPEWIDLEKARAVAVGLEGRGQVRVHDEEFEPGTADAVWLHRAGVERLAGSDERLEDSLPQQRN
jgi:hypothetical protein